LFDFNLKADAKTVLSRGTAVFAGLNGNTAFTIPPPVDLTVFKSTLDDLSAAIGDAMDGGKKAIADRNKKKEAVVRMLRQLAHYVEANCKDDINILLSSGFAVVNTIRKPIESLSQSIRWIDSTGVSGQLQVMLVSVPSAFSYELRWAPAGGPGEPPAPWTSQPVPKARPPFLVTGLTPGVTYHFQVRVLTESGFTDWSDSVSRMAT
jgi:hypothetical protein